jgi:hypothetical protein
LTFSPTKFSDFLEVAKNDPPKRKEENPCGNNSTRVFLCDDHGGDRRSEKAKGDQDNHVILKRQGNDATYLARRLLRRMLEFFLGNFSDFGREVF